MKLSISRAIPPRLVNKPNTHWYHSGSAELRPILGSGTLPHAHNYNKLWTKTATPRVNTALRVMKPPNPPGTVADRLIFVDSAPPGRVGGHIWIIQLPHILNSIKPGTTTVTPRPDVAPNGVATVNSLPDSRLAGVDGVPLYREKMGSLSRILNHPTNMYNSNKPETKTVNPWVDTAPHGVDIPKSSTLSVERKSCKPSVLNNNESMKVRQFR